MTSQSPPQKTGFPLKSIRRVIVPPSPVVSQPGAGYFALSELKQLNSGYYHDTCHALEVAQLVAEVALASGRSQVRAEFLKQVALIHDADPREDGTPARVSSTLAWMESERAKLEQRFGWHGLQFEEAFALIARTDFPFDQVARHCGTRFDGMSPVEVYRDALWRLPRELREQCMTDALLLRFCDQISSYVGSFGRAQKSVHDLVAELNNTGLSLTLEGTMRNTPGFLRQIGTELQHDEKLKGELNLGALQLPTRARLFANLGWKRRLRFTRNLVKFQFS